MIISMSCGHMSEDHGSFYYVGNSPPGKGREVKIWVDKEFGEGDRIGMEDAVAQWNYAMNGYVHYKVESYDFDMQIEIIKRVERGEGWLFLKIDSSNGMLRSLDHGGMTIAFVNKIGGNRIYFVRDRMGNEWMKAVSLHEMGHLMGAEHDEGTLMNAYFNLMEYKCIDKRTVEQVGEHEGIPADHLKYCVAE